jgi:predicted dehydrogenase
VKRSQYWAAAGEIATALPEQTRAQRYAVGVAHPAVRNIDASTLTFRPGDQRLEVMPDAAAAGPEKDDVQVTVRFENGFSSVITYATSGNVHTPKEMFDAAGDSCSARLDNFRKAMVWTGQAHHSTRVRDAQDKDQRTELAQLVQSSQADAAMPIPSESLVTSTRATIVVRDSLPSVRRERV